MLSLINGSTLGFDLVRLQNGPLVADMVLGALAVRPGDLEHLTSPAPTDDPPGLWDGAGLRSSNSAVPAPPTERHGGQDHPPVSRGSGRTVPRSDLPNGMSVPAPGELTVRDVPARASRLDTQADTSLESLASLLRSATIGSLDALIAMLRREVFSWTWRLTDDESLAARPAAAGELATTCLAAVSAAYGAADLRDPHVDTAVSRWYRLHGRLPRRSVPLGPQQLQLAVLLERIRSLTGPEVQDLLEAYHRHQPAQLWAPAVHEATWAAYLSGRVAAAAAAQLHLVAAVRQAGVSLDDVADGFWNVVSGAVSAVVVLDLLDDVSCDLLLARYPVLARSQE